MNSDLPQKELLIAVVENTGSILMRKKPAGSPPYKETWYLFGCASIAGHENKETLMNYLKAELGIDVKVSDRIIPHGFEIKKDHDGVEKSFVYINFLCKYLSGEPKLPGGVEKIEWIQEGELSQYDLIPPSVELLTRLGFLKGAR